MKRLKIKRIQLLLAMGLLASGVLIAPETQAFPGGNGDERCDERVTEAATAYRAGQTVETPDCIYAPGMSAIEMRAAYANMLRYPTPPEVVQTPIVSEIVNARNYRRLVGDVEIFNAPDGSVVGSISAGFNLVSVGAITPNWVQIGTDQWVKTESTSDFQVSEFSGVEITRPLERPMAWMVDNTRGKPVYPSLYPGGPPDETQARIAHHTLLTIYGIEVVDGYEWYLVGPNQWIRQTLVAKVLPVQRPVEIGPNELWVAVDLYEQTAIAYEGDRMVFATLTSTGRDGYPTNEGLFRIYQRHTATRMTGASGQPDSYFIERVPWVMYFDGDIALHGAYWHNRFGYRTSAGCVNVSILDGHWFYQWTEKSPDGATWVYVYSSGVYGRNIPAWARPVLD